MTDDTLTERVAELEHRIQHVEMMIDVVLRLMSASHPLATVLQQFNATRSQEQALYRLFDGYASRLDAPEREHPSFGDFRNQIAGIFPAERDNRDFLQLLIDTLGADRAEYRKLHSYMTRQGWSALVEKLQPWRL